MGIDIPTVKLRNIGAKRVQRQQYSIAGKQQRATMWVDYTSLVLATLMASVEGK